MNKNPIPAVNKIHNSSGVHSSHVEEGAATAVQFRAKVLQMKTWKPLSTPSNRDRLELYALHKQAVSSDAPSHLFTSKARSPAEKAKLNAWNSKRGLSQSQSMTLYIVEAERQLRTYGTENSNVSKGFSTQKSAGEDHDHFSNSTNSKTAGSVLLTPRGLAAIPLLCAAASETRFSYLARLQMTNQLENGWWTRQEPLCGNPGSILALPEAIVLLAASGVERASLFMHLNENFASLLRSIGLNPGVLQSFLWPAHNALLVVWMMVIFLYTLTGSSLITLKTLVLGSKRTGVNLENIFSQEIRPCKHGLGSLCESHQTASVRLLGLVLYPLGALSNITECIAKAIPLNPGGQLYVASCLHIFIGLFFWWYWYIILPSMAVAGLVISISIGWCFGLIELANF